MIILLSVSLIEKVVNDDTDVYNDNLEIKLKRIFCHNTFFGKAVEFIDENSFDDNTNIVTNGIKTTKENLHLKLDTINEFDC